MTNENVQDQQLDFFEEEKDDLKQMKTQEIQQKTEQENDGLIVTASGEQFTQEEWTSPVFEGGPTRQEVEEWKEKYGNVYFIPLADNYYIFRALTRAEYREVIENQDLTLLDREEIFTEKCVLFPRNYRASKDSKGNAGVPSALAEVIMDKSGFIAQSAPIKL